jgi:ubiquinone/menaquinone biosynthesis C-methylase UbiE
MSFGYLPPRQLAPVLRHPFAEFVRWILGQDNLIKRAHVRETMRLLDLRPTDHVLEVGAGGLAYAAEMARRVAWLVAIDYAPAVGAPLGALRFPDNLDVVRGDAQKLPFADASFDKVFISEVFPVLDDAGSCVREISRVLRPGGLVVAVHGDMFREMEEVFSWRISQPLLRRAAKRFNAPADYESFRRTYLALHGTRSAFFEDRDGFVRKIIAASGFEQLRCSWRFRRRARLLYCFLLLNAMAGTGRPLLGRGQSLFLPLVHFFDWLDRDSAGGLTIFCAATKPLAATTAGQPPQRAANAACDAAAD